MGVKNDGTITALEQILYWDAGAYVEYGANIVNAAGLSATGPYRIDNVKMAIVFILLFINQVKQFICHYNL